MQYKMIGKIFSISIDIQKQIDMQMEIQAQSWPYDFAASDDFPKSDQRGTVRGKMLVYDRYRLYDLPSSILFCNVVAT